MQEWELPRDTIKVFIKNIVYNKTFSMDDPQLLEVKKNEFFENNGKKLGSNWRVYTKIDGYGK
jgi:hypothetical protein